MLLKAQACTTPQHYVYNIGVLRGEGQGGLAPPKID